MSDATVAMVLAAVLVAGGCAPAATTAPADAGARAPAPEGPTNFASPHDIIQRYPTMRRQQL